MCAEQQRLFRELHRHSQSVKTSMEATEQTAKADREQVCLVALPRIIVVLSMIPTTFSHAHCQLIVRVRDYRQS